MCQWIEILSYEKEFEIIKTNYNFDNKEKGDYVL